MTTKVRKRDEMLEAVGGWMDLLYLLFVVLFVVGSFFTCICLRYLCTPERARYVCISPILST